MGLKKILLAGSINNYNLEKSYISILENLGYKTDVFNISQSIEKYIKLGSLVKQYTVF